MEVSMGKILALESINSSYLNKIVNDRIVKSGRCGFSHNYPKSVPAVVLCHGCFDLLHYGHVKHLQHAREFGSLLIVTVTADKFVNKGDGRPIFNESSRAMMLAALECVDIVAISNYETAIDAIRIIRPTIYIKGGEYKDKLTQALVVEKVLVESFGGRVEFTPPSDLNTTALIRMIKGIEPDSTRPYPRGFCKVGK